jgi:hypothetical protein
MLVSFTDIVRIQYASAAMRPLKSPPRVLKVVSFAVVLTILNFVLPILSPLSKIGDRTPCRN